ncbi:OLC1v1037614C1 [Oldenlandia corymbosa var. corymbosa]|uniref:OLC1v1037614C1 n=1 Tax=Oldenlandia corymbosa var. corymbosa TaxID=529605 RepID=A0AAV1D0X7_OLDCO|nr:OLC1v1037614C1 [Oldenlandia corymbosa var. corymbosa]
MMIGERNHANHTIHVPPWPSSFPDSPAADFSCLSPGGGNANCSPNFDDYSYALTALQRYLPSNVKTNLTDLLLEDFDPENEDAFAKDLDLPVDAYSCDQFRMFEFKVRKCMRGRSHDWTECPYAHPGEKARRRDPRKYHYSGTACPDFRKGSCRKGDACEFAHGVFECWLHPARYRTQPCKDGMNCKRRVCFFAHSPDQLRVLSPRAESYDGSPHRLAFDGSFSKALQFMSSPESGSPPSESPPMSPLTTASSMNPLSRSLGSNSINEMMASMRQLQLNKVQSANSSWGLQASGGSALGSPRMVMSRAGYCSLPSTPTRMANRNGIGYFDNWDNGGCEEEPQMERVESGRDLRAKIFQKLSKENPLDRADPNSYDAPNPDVGWVTELIK